MNNIIKEVYETNFGTAYEVYKEAVKINSSIRLQDVKDYLSKRDDKQVHLKLLKHNSFVSSHPLFEIEIDIMDIGTSVTNMRYGLVAIDNFTKIAHIVPIQNKQPDEIIRAVKEVFNEIGIPKIFTPMKKVPSIHRSTLNLLMSIKLNTYKLLLMPQQLNVLSELSKIICKED